MTNDEILTLFKEKQALLEGHFLLSSGLHSNRYLQCALVLQHPAIAEKLGKALAAQVKGPVDVVVSPAMGGLIIGHEVARALNVRGIFTEKDDAGKPIFRRGFALQKKERVLVVEDVLTTGLSTAEVLHLVETNHATPVGVSAVVNRSVSIGNKKLLRWELPIHALLKLDVQSWEQPDCPLCKTGVPVLKPGSRKQ